MAIVTLAGRKWGSLISGIIASIPWVGGPIILFISIEQGKTFAVQSIPGTMVGIMAWMAFCMSYVVIGKRKASPLASALAGYIGYFTLSIVLNFLMPVLSIDLLYGIALISTICSLLFLPKVDHTKKEEIIKRFRYDLPMRMISATLIVVLITYFAQNLGPIWSGILTPIPVITAVLGVFTHYSQGLYGAREIYRGIMIGMIGFMTFMFLLAKLLPVHSIFISFIISLIIDIVLILVMTFLMNWIRRRARYI